MEILVDAAAPFRERNPTKIAMRVFVDGEKRYEYPSIDHKGFEVFMITHQAEIRNTRHMIELEFLDEPDPLQRFSRFGTDPRGMVQPISVQM